MKKLTLKAFLTVLLVFIAVFSFTGCDFLLETIIEGLFTTVDGTVVNAKATGDTTEYWKAGDNTLEGASIKLYSYNKTSGSFSATADYSTTVSSTGSYSIAEVLVGKYKVVGEAAGWTFVPRVVDIAGEDVNLPTIMAYPEADEYTATILVSWEDEDLDLDSYLTYYNGTSRDYIGYTGPGYNYSYISDSSETILNYDRDVSLSTDASIPRVETITVVEPLNSAPFFGDDTLDSDGIPYNELRFYVKLYNTDDGSLTGLDADSGSKKSAFAQVDVMYQGASGTDAEHFGSRELPWNTDENLLHVVTFKGQDSGTYYYYDITSAGYDTQIRSVSSVE